MSVLFFLHTWFFFFVFKRKWYKQNTFWSRERHHFCVLSQFILYLLICRVLLFREGRVSNALRWCDREHLSNWTLLSHGLNFSCTMPWWDVLKHYRYRQLISCNCITYQASWFILSFLDEGAEACDDCPSGTYCLSGEGVQPCPAGHYCLGGSVEGILPCPPGTYSPKFGLSQVEQCLICPAGESIVTWLSSLLCKTLGRFS